MMNASFKTVFIVMVLTSMVACTGDIQFNIDGDNSFDGSNAVVDDDGNGLDTPVDYPQRQNLLAYYRLNETDGAGFARDSSGNDAHTEILGQAMFRAGYAGNALNVHNSYFHIPEAVIGQINQELTLSFYAKGYEGVNYKSIVWGEDSTGAKALSIVIPWGADVIYDAGADNGYDRVKGTVVVDYSGVWNHWAFTKNAATGEMKVYLAGELVLSDTQKYRDFSTLSQLIIGRNGDGTGYNGVIDEVALYNVSLDQTDIQRIAGVEMDDTDQDGIVNRNDPDDDNDGIDDANDLFRLNPDEAYDTDNGGIGNNADPDDDNDGILDIDDAFPQDETEWSDADGDGTGDNTDVDDNNDGVADAAPAVLAEYNLAQESYAYEHIHTFKVQGGIPGEDLLKLANTLTAYGDYYYVLYMELGTGRPMIRKINQQDSRFIEDAYLEAADYIPLDDSHHHFTMEVDGDGHLHIVGDMHNGPQNRDHLPERLKNTPVLYWRTEHPEQIDSIRFYGDQGKFAPQIPGVTYAQMFKDRQGAVYMTARASGNNSNPGGTVITNRGAGLTRYNPDTWTWELIGGYPKEEENPTAEDKFMVYEPEPMAPSTFYIKTIPGLAFDNANRMHFAAVANNNDSVVFNDIAQSNGMARLWGVGTDLVYVGSENLTHFNEADGMPVTLPAGADSDDDGDVVFTRNDPFGPAVLGIAPKVTTNRFGHPVILFSQKKLYDVQGAGWDSGSTIAEWDGSQWQIHTTIGPDGISDPGFDALFADPGGVMTGVTFKNFYRMWSIDGGHRIFTKSELDMPHYVGELSRSFTQETGDFLGRYFDKNTQELTIYRIRVTRP